MSITSGGTLGSVQNKSSSATLNLPITAAVPVGAVVVLFLAYDNSETTDSWTASCLISDAKGNEYIKFMEASKGTPGANNGATMVMAFCNVRTALASGDNITITFKSARVAKAASAWRFNVAAGNVGFKSSGTAGSGTGTSSGFGHSGTGTTEKLWLFAVAAEGAPTATTPAGHTAATPQSTSGGGAATNMGVRPFFKIDSLDASNPSTTLGVSSDWASVAGILVEKPEYLPRPKAETLVDRFEGTLAQWPMGYGGTVIETGRAKIPCITGWAALKSAYNSPGNVSQAWGLDLGNSSVHARVYPPDLGNGGREIHMEVYVDYFEHDLLEMYVKGSTLYSRTRRNREYVPVSNAAYDSINHAWWRIRESAGTVYFETSPDGITWTQFGVTIPRPFPVSQVYLSFLCFYTGTETVDYAYLDDVNYVPPVFPLDETLIDDFNRADAKVDVGAGAAIWKSAWYDGGVDTDVRVIGNQLGLLVNQYSPAYTLRSLQKNCDVIIDCVAPPAAPNYEFGLYFCMTDVPSGAFDGYALFWASGTWILRRYANGVNAGNIVTGPGTLVAGDSIWVSKVGSALKLYKKPSGGNYALVLQGTNALHDLPGKIIVELSDSTQRWENLRGGPFVLPSRSVVVI